MSRHAALVLYSFHNRQSLIYILFPSLSSSIYPSYLTVIYPHYRNPYSNTCFGPDFDPTSHLISTLSPSEMLDSRNCESLIYLTALPFPFISAFPLPDPDHTCFDGGSSSKSSHTLPAKPGDAAVSLTLL